MNNKKLTNVLIGVWGITSALIIVGLIVQMALPNILKNNEYMEMLFDVKQSLILALISVIITYFLLFVTTTQIEKVQRYTKKIVSKKPIVIVVSAFSIFFCLIFILMDYTTIASSVITSNNVKTLDGKVEKIQSKTLDNSDEVITMVTVVDSNGKKYKMVPKSDIQLMSVFKGSKVHFDYVDTPNMKPDGTILGYETVVSDDTKEQKENIKGILNEQ